MTHKQIVSVCAKHGMAATRCPSYNPLARAFEAIAVGVRVSWTTSFEGGLLSNPRLSFPLIDTHVNSARQLDDYLND
jgi:hypothetical protein